MKILLVSSKHDGGGTYTVFMQETQLLQAHGHEVAHFSLAYDTHKIHCTARHYTGFPDTSVWIQRTRGPLQKWVKLLYNVDKRSLWRKVLAPRFHAALQDFKPDVVHFHSFDDFYSHPELFEIPGKLGIPTVMTLHSAYYVCPAQDLLKGPDKGTRTLCDGICSRERPTLGASCETLSCISNPVKSFIMIREYRRLMAILPRCMDRYTVPSQALLDLVLASGLFPNSQTQRLYNPGNTELLAIQPDFHQPPKPTYFLTVGRLTPEKGVIPLVEAFAAMPQIPLVVVGDGTERGALETMIAQRGLSHITLAGWQSGEALWKLYQDSYGVIIPSQVFDNSPVVIQEAFAHAKPILATRVGGIPEFVREGETGYLFDIKDFDTLARHVQELWQAPQQAMMLGQAGYKLFHQFYNTQYTYEALMNCLQEAIRHHHHEATPVETVPVSPWESF